MNLCKFLRKAIKYAGKSFENALSKYNKEKCERHSY